MTGQELIILFKEDKAYLTLDKSMTFVQLGLPVIAKTFKSIAYWKIRVINYRDTEKKLFCEIISYHVGETEFTYNQIALSSILIKLKSIAFRSIDTAGLLKTLSGRVPVSILPNVDIPVDRTINEFNLTQIKKEPIKQFINETFSVPLKNVRFKMGGVSFDRKFNEHKNTLEITIENYDIRVEFDAVKNYFANVLKTKKIQVTVCVEITDNEIISIEAKSPEIEKIDKQLIDNVKFEFVKSTIRKKIRIDIDKNLFTMDEYFNTFADEKFQSNTFFKNDRELLEDLIKISDTKHYKQLRFLSSKHAHDIMKLRFVHKPFSFVFLIEGERNYHLIWETLDTEEATYVWHITKDIKVLKMTLRKIEDIIYVIKIQGKTAYLSSSDDQFRRIYHDYSIFIDGFIKWKSELENYLT